MGTVAELGLQDQLDMLAKMVQLVHKVILDQKVIV
jgi:hypothetical protein